MHKYQCHAEETTSKNSFKKQFILEQPFKNKLPRPCSVPGELRPGTVPARIDHIFSIGPEAFLARINRERCKRTEPK